MIETAEPIFHPESNLRAWLVTFILMGAATLGYRTWTQVTPYRAPTVEAEGARWFVVLKMPESPVDKAGQRAAARRLELWLHGLHAAGFHPMLLSEVLQRLHHDGTLPQKTVVLLYDPGYLCTYEAVAPVLFRYKVPAFWVTNGPALHAADRRFLSYHALRQMKKSGLWDVALFNGNTSFAPGSHLHSWDARMTGAWDVDDSRRAVNRLSTHHHLDRLPVNPEWTEQQLVDRLLSEVPVEGPVHLTVRTIKNKAWGMAIPKSNTNGGIAVAFTLEPRQRFQRTATVEWLGTRGLKNFNLEMNATGVTGDLHILLRADRDAGECVHLCLTRDMIWIDQEHAGRQTRLASCPWTRPLQHPFHISADLMGPRLSVFVDHKRLLALHTLQHSGSVNGEVIVEVSHRLRGVAQARSLEVALTPWQKSR